MVLWDTIIENIMTHFLLIKRLATGAFSLIDYYLMNNAKITHPRNLRFHLFSAQSSNSLAMNLGHLLFQQRGQTCPRV